MLEQDRGRPARKRQKRVRLARTLVLTLMAAAVEAVADADPSSAAQAGIDVAAYCAARPNLPPLPCFVAATNDALVTCQLIVKLGTDGARLDAELRRLKGLPDDPSPPSDSCIDIGLATSGPIYRRALVGKPAGMVKDYYAAWRAAMAGVRPMAGESNPAYSARQAKAVADLKRRGERLQLE